MEDLPSGLGDRGRYPACFMSKLTSPQSARSMVESKIDLRGELRIDDVVSMFGQWELHLGDGLLDEYRWKADGAWELVADFANGLMYSISAEHVVFRRTTDQHEIGQKPAIWKFTV